uniref:N-acylethanolamine-hydrolyzing acid amidase n=1 Tax=Meloidogyne enterolobii TaxID=390850 RepID=A0A6V7VFG5_MELEN|nr:unnamed protein product [Meloidogyne enterolobii]
MKFLLIYFLIILFQLTITKFGEARQPKLFKINLDKPPRERWKFVIEKYKDNVIPEIAAIARSYIPTSLRSPIFEFFAKIVHLLPHDYGEEIIGMAEELRDTKVSLGELVVFNILYDLTDFSHGPFLKNNKSLSLGCTSIVAAQNNGKILHGRNLDYEMTQVLKDATILVDFVKNGKIQYTAVTFVLAVGIITGQKPNAFTVSLNARYSGGPILNILMELITRFKHPVALQIRKTLEFEQDYVSALSQLSWTYMIAPSYLIVGGKDGDGAIITRDRLGAVDVFTLDYRHYRWFLLETNFDHWKKSGDNRRKYGRKFMKKIGKENLTAKLMFEKVLSKWPIKNGLTISSTVMSAEEPNLIYNWTVVWGN